MTFKTWEKVYWGILGFFFTISSIVPLFKEGKIKVEVQNKTIFVSKWTYIGYLVLGYVIVFVPLWIIIRLIVNGGWEDKEKKKINFILYIFVKITLTN